MKKSLIIIGVMLMLCCAFLVGCGNDNGNVSTTGQSQSGVGNGGTSDVTGAGNAVGDAATGVGDAAADIVTGAGDIVGDVVTGAGDIVSDAVDGR